MSYKSREGACWGTTLQLELQLCVAAKPDFKWPAAPRVMSTRSAVSQSPGGAPTSSFMALRNTYAWHTAEKIHNLSPALERLYRNQLIAVFLSIHGSTLSSSNHASWNFVSRQTRQSQQGSCCTSWCSWQILQTFKFASYQWGQRVHRIDHLEPRKLPGISFSRWNRLRAVWTQLCHQWHPSGCSALLPSHQDKLWLFPAVNDFRLSPMAEVWPTTAWSESMAEFRSTGCEKDAWKPTLYAVQRLRCRWRPAVKFTWSHCQKRLQAAEPADIQVGGNNFKQLTLFLIGFSLRKKKTSCMHLTTREAWETWVARSGHLRAATVLQPEICRRSVMPGGCKKGKLTGIRIFKLVSSNENTQGQRFTSFLLRASAGTNTPGLPTTAWTNCGRHLSVATQQGFSLSLGWTETGSGTTVDCLDLKLDWISTPDQQRQKERPQSLTSVVLCFSVWDGNLQFSFVSFIYCALKAFIQAELCSPCLTLVGDHSVTEQIYLHMLGFFWDVGWTGRCFGQWCTLCQGWLLGRDWA